MELQLSENALRVLSSRYLLKNDHGEIMETPGQLFARVASAIAKGELSYGGEKDRSKWEKKFYDVMSALEFVPNSPTLMNAGTSMNQLSACYVLPVHDDMTSIFTTLLHTALIQKSGGGTGFNFSELRNKSDYVASTGGESSGPVSFMKIYDAATDNIKQGGKRRGANMGILNCNHPDIEEFISMKSDGKTLTNFNISAGATDDFMNAVAEEKEWQLISPHTKEVVKKVKAKDIWNRIVNNAWSTGDPGLIFLDTINKFNPTPAVGQIECTNPCGEVPLLPYESCNLGSIDLSKCISAKNVRGDFSAEIDYRKLEDLIVTSVRFLDNVIEVNNYLIPEIKNMVTGNRKTGLGVMGWAEMLIKLRVDYASEEAVELGEKLMKFINEKSFDASVELAKQRGAFSNWEKSIYYPHTKIRNATRTSIAPTGTISIIANTSSSIEPLFALAYRREHVLRNESLMEVNSLFVDYLKKNNLYSESIIEKIKYEGIAGGIDELPVTCRNLFKTSMEIDYVWHIRHQVAFQKYTDNAVSKTINLPNHASEEDIANAYLMAWKLDAKGITIFRDGSKGLQVLNKGIHTREEAMSCKVCVN
jgi:ribonucleoside-diphosphate reductase alpha chain